MKCKRDTILCKGLEHLQILVSTVVLAAITLVYLGATVVLRLVGHRTVTTEWGLDVRQGSLILEFNPYVLYLTVLGWLA